MKKLVALFFIAGVTLCTAATANAQALKVAVPPSLTWVFVGCEVMLGAKPNAR